MKLTGKLETLILMATKRAGSYDPMEVMYIIEEDLTIAEHKAVYGFLRWVQDGIESSEEYPGRRFGHGTIKERWKQFSVTPFAKAK